MASFAPVLEHLNLRVEFRHALEKIPQCDGHCHLSALEAFAFDPGNLGGIPFQHTG